MFENNEEKELEDESPVAISNVFNQGFSVVVSFVSSFVLSRLLLPTARRTEIIILVTLLFVEWMLIDPMIRNGIKIWFKLINGAKMWKKAIYKIINFFSLLGIFLIFQLFFVLITESWDIFAPSTAEAFVSIIVIIITFISIILTINFYQNPSSAIENSYNTSV